MTARIDGGDDSIFARPATSVNVITPLVRLEQYVRARRYAGHDPYDALGSPIIRSVPSPMVRMALTQLLVYSPVDLRRSLKIAPGTNPKAIALFISSYCNMRRCGLMSPETFDEITAGLVEELLRSQVPGYHGLCWGIYFDLQDGRSVIEPSMPSIVPTSFAGHAFLDLYDVTGDRRYLEHALSCCDFIANDLNILEAEEGLCFSYRPEDHKAIHNANVMGAALLSRASSQGGPEEFRGLAARAFDFSVAHQEDDGSWAYGIDPQTGRKRFQIDYHQGFILDSLIDFLHYSRPGNPRYQEALLKGMRFFRREQFDPSGRSLWRLPWRWPVDIHHQAQGIVTFSKGWRHDPANLPFALTIADWTIENMLDRDGHFYHHKYPVGANHISYIRWSQAWMMFSLSQLVRSTEEAVEDDP